ncbi:hypothetical protein C477_17920 [Haloterrigena salina JCM 13891]|uniref:Uncharacterized protein n=1 Tax=Haloterrigena salina JCM 13891 TaxID=1227488 RepID=M0BX34_9EURY|nr:hypothetical protein C477_17920 [Haloterrigena salina JCM 13891]
MTELPRWRIPQRVERSRLKRIKQMSNCLEIASDRVYVVDSERVGIVAGLIVLAPTISTVAYLSHAT